MKNKIKLFTTLLLTLIMVGCSSKADDIVKKAQEKVGF